MTEALTASLTYLAVIVTYIVTTVLGIVIAFWGNLNPMATIPDVNFPAVVGKVITGAGIGSGGSASRELLSRLSGTPASTPKSLKIRS